MDVGYILFLVENKHALFVKKKCFRTVFSLEECFFCTQIMRRSHKVIVGGVDGVRKRSWAAFRLCLSRVLHFLSLPQSERCLLRLVFLKPTGQVCFC